MARTRLGAIPRLLASEDCDTRRLDRFITSARATTAVALALALCCHTAHADVLDDFTTGPTHLVVNESSSSTETHTSFVPLMPGWEPERIIHTQASARMSMTGIFDLGSGSLDAAFAVAGDLPDIGTAGFSLSYGVRFGLGVDIASLGNRVGFLGNVTCDQCYWAVLIADFDGNYWMFEAPTPGPYSDLVINVGSPWVDTSRIVVLGLAFGTDTPSSIDVHLTQIFIGDPRLCDSIDFNNDTSFFVPQDIDAFLSVYGEGPCIPETATCNDIDFNNDSSIFDPCDIDTFLSVYGEGPCAPCGE